MTQWLHDLGDILYSRLDKLGEGQNQNSSELKALRELTQRQFTNAYHRQQANIDTHCPNVFVLRTPEAQKLQLYCQAPPYLNRLIAVLKYAAPPMGAWADNIQQTLAKQLPNNQGDLDAALHALHHLLKEQDPQ